MRTSTPGDRCTSSSPPAAGARWRRPSRRRCDLGGAGAGQVLDQAALAVAADAERPPAGGEPVVRPRARWGRTVRPRWRRRRAPTGPGHRRHGTTPRADGLGHLRPVRQAVRRAGRDDRRGAGGVEERNQTPSCRRCPRRCARWSRGVRQPQDRATRGRRTCISNGTSPTHAEPSKVSTTSGLGTRRCTTSGSKRQCRKVRLSQRWIMLARSTVSGQTGLGRSVEHTLLSYIRMNDSVHQRRARGSGSSDTRDDLLRAARHCVRSTGCRHDVAADRGAGRANRRHHVPLRVEGRAHRRGALRRDRAPGRSCPRRAGRRGRTGAAHAARRAGALAEFERSSATRSSTSRRCSWPGARYRRRALKLYRGVGVRWRR